MRNLNLTNQRSFIAIAAMLILAAAGLGVRALADDDKPKPPEASVAIVKDAPKIDGVLDDAIWKDATELKDFKEPEGAVSKAKTRVLLAHDDKSLYIAVECFEDADKIKKLVADTKDHDGDIWQDDSFELFIDPANDRMHWYHLGFNSRNVSLDGFHSAGDDPRHGDMKWNPKFQSAAKVGDSSWVVEIAFPLDQFDRSPVANDKWAFNFLRTRAVDGDRQLSYWSPIVGASHQPDKFGVLTNMPTWKDRAVGK